MSPLSSVQCLPLDPWARAPSSDVGVPHAGDTTILEPVGISSTARAAEIIPPGIGLPRHQTQGFLYHPASPRLNVVGDEASVVCLEKPIPVLSSAR